MKSFSTFLAETIDLRDLDDPVKSARLVATLPKDARTEDGAERLWHKTIMDRHSRGDLEFYHESPGDVAESMRRKGIVGDYGVFAALGQPSGFAAKPKTIVKFKVPANIARNIGPDMAYAAEHMTSHQYALLEHPDRLLGAYVSIGEERIPPSWITGIEVQK